MEKLDKRLNHKSREIVKALRHKPELYNLTLDDKGYVSIQHILKEFNITWNELERIVELNDKKRLEFDPILDKIRAAQGHSINIDIDDTLVEITPNDNNLDGYLYHGTSVAYLDSILTNGIMKMTRNHVHLSKDRDTAIKVGSRHAIKNKEDKMIIIVIRFNVLCCHEKVYESSNGVILTRFVPPCCISDIIEIDLKNKETHTKATEYANTLTNKIKTPDGTILESRHQYDHVSHVDKNGERYTIDGGHNAFVARSTNIEPYYNLSISDTEVVSFRVIRKHLMWGHRGKSGQEPVQYIALADMADDHILNVMLNVKGIDRAYKKQFIRELDYRLKNNIFIPNDKIN